MRYATMWSVLLLVAMSGAAHGRYLREPPEPRIHLGELTGIWLNNADNGGDQHELAERVLQSVFPDEHVRRRRQVHGSGSLNSAGGMDINLATPLKETDHGTLSAIGSVSGLGKDGGTGYGRAGGGLSFNTDSGHGASVLMSHVPDFGNQLTGAGRVNLLDTDKHKFDAGAFVTRTFPSASTGLTDFNTYGGNLGYQFNDKLGATLSAAHTPLFDRTDVSAMGNYNLFKDPSSSLDLNGGFSRSFSPYNPTSRWEPSVGIGFTKYW